MIYEITLWRGYGRKLDEPVYVEADNLNDALALASEKDANANYHNVNDLTPDRLAELSSSTGCWTFVDRSKQGKSKIYLNVERMKVRRFQTAQAKDDPHYLLYKGILFDDFTINEDSVWAELCNPCAARYATLLADELDDGMTAPGCCGRAGCSNTDEESDHGHYYVDFDPKLVTYLKEV